MADLASAVAALVRGAETEADPRRLRGSVEGVLAAFSDASIASRNAAVDAIGKALAGAAGEHASAQVLALAMGALVEAGASAERAWPPLAKDLLRRLELAATFAEAVLRKARSDDLEAALADLGAELAKKHPAAAAAWQAVPSRCLAGVACLTHSRAVRAQAQANAALAQAAFRLGGAIDEVGYFLQALRIIDGETWLVLAPDLGRGWRVQIDAMPSNGELYVLLWDAISRQPSGAALTGDRPDRKAVAALQRGEPPPRPKAASVPFDLLAWTAVDGEGALRPTSGHEDSDHDHDASSDAVLDPDGLPADVPAFDDERVVVLRTGNTRSVPIAPSFEGLRPRVEIVGEVGAAEVVRAVVRIATARAAAEAVSKAATRAAAAAAKRGGKTNKTKKKRASAVAPKAKRKAGAKKRAKKRLA
jgi:hypothetical protein